MFFPKFQTLLLLCAFTASLFAATAATAQYVATDGTQAAATNTQSDYVIVTFQDPAAASYTGGIAGYPATKPARGKKLKTNDPAVQNYLRRLNIAHANFRSFLNANAKGAQVVREFFLVNNAVAVKLNGNRAETLASAPGVKSVDASWLYHPRMDVSVDWIRASNVWPSVGGREGAGTGVKVGVIDSGIDETHPFFACKGKIQHRQYASGIVGFNPNKLITSTHGTHVSGTIGGCVTTLTSGPVTGPISGIAPGSQLFDYNVFPGFGVGHVFLEDSAFSHDIIEAVEDSVADGMDVINLSIGGGVQGPHDALADAINSAVDAGVVAAVAAGNSGPGIFTVESPGSALNALTAGAITNPHFIGVPVINGSSTFGAVIGQFGALTAFTATAYVVTAPVNGCGAGLTNAAAVSGKIALIQRGVCTFSEKIRNAQTAGALAVIVSQNRLGDPIVMGQDGTPNQPTIPGVMVNRASGTALAAAAVKTVDVGTTEQEFLTAADGSGDLLADFSSHGPTPFTYLIKPDVTAPGVNVYSSVFDENDFSVKTFELFQGTSMATPHLSGTAVLLRQLHPDWSAFDIKSIIVNAAPNPVKDAFTAADPVQRFLARGNGRVDVVNANASPLSFNPVSASFGFFNGNVPVQSSLNVTVTNLTSTAQSCTTAKSVTLSLGLNLAGVPAPSTSILSVPASIGLAAGASQTVTFGLNAGQSTSIASGFYGGDVTLTCGSTTLRVPWFFLVSREGKP